MKVRKQLTWNQKMFGVLLQDQSLFMRHFWRDEITLPPSTRQKLFWNDISPKVLHATGRKTGKTLGIEGRIIRKSIAYRGKTRISERMFAAPGEQQLQPTLIRLMSKVESNPLFKMLRAGYNKNDGVLRWHTNVMWHARIDGTAGDDRNMVGLRLDEIIFDESAFTTRACHSSRKQSALPGCMWLYAGVPNSVRHTPFWELDQTRQGAAWSHHKTSTFANPLYWDIKRRDDLIEDYNGRDNPDYATQVMGVWSVELQSSFPPDQIAINEALPYRLINLTQHDIPKTLDCDPMERVRLAAKLQLPKVKALQFIVGMDYGFHQDPTEIGIAYRDTDAYIWKMLGRIHLVGADPLAQARLLYFLGESIGRDRIGRVAIDLQHAGIAVALELSQIPHVGEWWQTKIIDLNSGGTIELQDPLDENKKLKVRRKQWITQELQAALFAARSGLELKDKPQLWLAKDADVSQELIDTREQKMPSGYVVYLARSIGKHKMMDHNTDMLRAVVLAAITAQKDGIIEDEEIPETVWAGANPFNANWQAPWEARG